MDTREMMLQARDKGITIKLLSEITGIKLSTLYNFSYGNNLSREKEEKLRNNLMFLLDM